MPLNNEDVEKIAELARLQLAPDEAASFTRQLGAILEYMTKLNELDTSGVEPMSHSSGAAGDMNYTMRDDAVRPCLGQEVATANAPDPESGFFRVPRVIGG
jgi:aspartyl-tRNA(Asn)/glutamyl-tRNA(Gln) amidotransferase subunit C